MAEEAKLSLHLGSDPTLAVLRVGGEELTAAKRRALRQSLDDNDLDEIRFDACVFRDGPNANAFRFRQQDLAFFGASFAGQPFLRDHDTHSIESRDGTILASRLEQGAFIQEIAITTARGMRAFVEGQIDRFSIGWYFDAVTCSVCNQDLLRSNCPHWPGDKYKVRVDDGAEVEVLCEAIFENPSGKETSAVNAPAVPGTGILAQLQFLKERSMAGAAPAANQPDEEVTTMADTIKQEEDVQPVQPQTQTPDWTAYLQRHAMEAALAASGLPAASRDAVRAAVGLETTPAQLDALIDAQRTLIAALQKDQVVTGLDRPLDGGRISGMTTGLDKVSAALEALISGKQPAGGVRPLSGIREAYILLSGDYEMRGMFNPDNVGLANVTSTTMAGLVANVLNKVVVNMFQAYPTWWTPIVFEEDFATLQTIKWITLGGVGELPTVSEGAAYTELTWDDQSESASWLKKGGYLGITLEAMDKDDTRRLQNAPRALAQAAYLTLSKAVSAIFTGTSGTGPLMSDSVRLFAGGHNNLGTTALSYNAWNATRIAMRKQTELNSGERLGGLVVPKYVLVPPDLEGTALTVLLSEGQPGTGNNDENPWAEGPARDARLANAQRRVIVVDLWTDTTDWAAVADPTLYPSIGIGYRYGRTPEIFSVADRNSGLMFSNDVMPIKVRWFFATGPTDWRGLYKHNVAGG